MFADLPATISDGHARLSPELYTKPSQFNTKSLLVDGFQKSWAKLSVHGNGRTDDLSGQSFELHFLGSWVPN